MTNKIIWAVLGLLLILVVNREFGAADNGDFARYLPIVASEPVDSDGMQPGPDNPDAYSRRYFNQPLWYWHPPASWDELPRRPSIHAGYLFWLPGKWLNDFLYSADVLNFRYIGLPFFLLHAIAFLYLAAHSAPNRLMAALVFAGGFLLFTDAKLTAFYNTLYAMSVPTLALFFIAAFFFPRIFLSTPPKYAALESGFLAMVLCMCLAAVFAAQKHMNFLAPFLIIACYAILQHPVRARGDLPQVPAPLLVLSSACWVTIATPITASMPFTTACLCMRKIRPASWRPWVCRPNPYP